jgi:hypothetical protein
MLPGTELAFRSDELMASTASGGEGMASGSLSIALPPVDCDADHDKPEEMLPVSVWIAD